MHVHPPSPTTQASMRRLTAEGLAVAPLIPLKCDAQVLHMYRHRAVYMQLWWNDICRVYIQGQTVVRCRKGCSIYSCHQAIFGSWPLIRPAWSVKAWSLAGSVRAGRSSGSQQRRQRHRRGAQQRGWLCLWPEPGCHPRRGRHLLPARHQRPLPAALWWGLCSCIVWGQPRESHLSIIPVLRLTPGWQAYQSMP